MIQMRKAAERGFGDHGWLKSYHSFSFAGYRDPAHMGFRALRVMNEDRVAPGQGFGTHAHDNMEIISYVLQGALSHKDSMGNGEVLRPGEFQCISAGSGITHSEFNPSATEPVHFYQIWLLPNVRNTTPSYQQTSYSIEDKRNRLCLVASPDGRDGSLVIRQDANVYLALLGRGQRLDYRVPVRRHVWMQLLSELTCVQDETSSEQFFQKIQQSHMDRNSRRTLEGQKRGKRGQLDRGQLDIWAQPKEFG
jgi:redox-sensitive bicupin YhaK (pirin superfamily)